MYNTNMNNGTERASPTELEELERVGKLEVLEMQENYADLIEDVLDELSDIFNFDHPKDYLGGSEELMDERERLYEAISTVKAQFLHEQQSMRHRICSDEWENKIQNLEDKVRNLIEKNRKLKSDIENATVNEEILRSSMAQVVLERDELKTKIQILENDNFNFVIFNLATISLCAALLFWKSAQS